MVASVNSSPLEIAFDIGHSSIGWAVLGTNETDPLPKIYGCGTVIFEKDSALACQRRLHRQQRRHVRATRQRMERMEKLLAHLGVMPAEELNARHCAGTGHPTPWLLAARVLASNGECSLTWPELWDVLRWYAHNRGYAPMGREEETDAEDTEKVENAKAAMAQFGKATMAETICAWFGQDPLAARIATTENYKAKGCAFERVIVADEVARILAAHRGKLAGMTDALGTALISDARAILVPTIKLPKRYKGGMLFGRLAMRYDNRIIGRCPISGGKLPLKHCPEFLRYRFALLLANIRVAGPADAELRTLSAVERRTLLERAQVQGYFTPAKFRDAVRELTRSARDNLDQMFMDATAAENLIFDPALKFALSNERLSALWPHLSATLQKHTLNRWRRGRRTTIAELRTQAAALGHNLASFDAALDRLCTQSTGRGKKKTEPPTREQVLGTRLEVAKLKGRAPFARSLLQKAFEEALAGRHPREEGGCLFETPALRRVWETRALDQQTNNHLVRHRLMLLGRLLRDLIADPAYGAGQPARVARVTIEVNRDLREMAGLTAQDIAKEMNERLRSHQKVSRRFEAELPPGTKFSGSLIRKGRIADDLGWTCPYTGVEFEPVDLVTKRVDLDHIVPRSQRASDSLDSLVVTFSAINKWKGARTAWQFINDEGGKPVPDAPNLSLVTPVRFRAFVEQLDTKGHPDDSRRKKRRKELLLLPRYEEKAGGFTPGQLTQTSQLARLGAQVVRSPFDTLPQQPDIVALPGTVTAAVRRGWSLLGCLTDAAPGILEPNGTLKSKTDIRAITHLHHALDACVLALTACLIPNRGDVWRLLTERRLNDAQKTQLAALGLFDFDAEGRFSLRDLPRELLQQIRSRLAERRVVQHVPADMSGMRVEENTRGIVKRKNGRVFLQQRKRDADGKRVVNETDEPEGKLLGLHPGKLSAANGVRVISDNFGVAILDDATLPPAERFVIIPWHKVWHRLEELKQRNEGKRPIIWRNGQVIILPKSTRSGRWRIFSIKNNVSGMALDLGATDAIRPNWINVLLKSLLRDGATLERTKLLGSA
jgi:hypothetical protein